MSSADNTASLGPPPSSFQLSSVQAQHAIALDNLYRVLTCLTAAEVDWYSVRHSISSISFRTDLPAILALVQPEGDEGSEGNNCEKRDNKLVQSRLIAAKEYFNNSPGDNGGIHGTKAGVPWQYFDVLLSALIRLADNLHAFEVIWERSETVGVISRVVMKLATKTRILDVPLSGLDWVGCNIARQAYDEIGQQQMAPDHDAVTRWGPWLVMQSGEIGIYKLVLGPGQMTRRACALCYSVYCWDFKASLFALETKLYANVKPGQELFAPRPSYMATADCPDKVHHLWTSDVPGWAAIHSDLYLLPDTAYSRADASLSSVLTTGRSADETAGRSESHSDAATASTSMDTISATSRHSSKPSSAAVEGEASAATASYSTVDTAVQSRSILGSDNAGRLAQDPALFDGKFISAAAFIAPASPGSIAAEPLATTVTIEGQPTGSDETCSDAHNPRDRSQIIPPLKSSRAVDAIELPGHPTAPDTMTTTTASVPFTARPAKRPRAAPSGESPTLRSGRNDVAAAYIDLSHEEANFEIERLKRDLLRAQKAEMTAKLACTTAQEAYAQAEEQRLEAEAILYAERRQKAVEETERDETAKKQQAAAERAKRFYKNEWDRQSQEIRTLREEMADQASDWADKQAEWKEKERKYKMEREEDAEELARLRAVLDVKQEPEDG